MQLYFYLMNGNKILKMKYLPIYLSAVAMLLLASCGNKSSEVNVSARAGNVDSTWVHITQEQFDAMDMQFGSLQDISFSHMLKVSGNIVSSVKGQAQITSRIAGTVRSISRELGDYVSAGAVLCTIESNDFVELQQNFIDVSSRYREAQATYDRLRTLYSDSITSKRDFIAAESAYRSLSAQYQGMKQQLRFLRANTDRIENGNIQSSMIITAPISGYITNINCMLGEYVTPEKSLMTLVNVNELYLLLNVYERDVSHLRVGQEVSFYNTNEPSLVQKAHISKIGKAIDPEKKTTPVIAQFDSSQTSVLNNTFVEADVVLDEKPGKGLPEEAVESVGETTRIYMLAKKDGNDIFLKPVAVTIGMKTNGYVEITNDIPSGEILIKGVYSLPAAE